MHLTLLRPQFLTKELHSAQNVLDFVNNYELFVLSFKINPHPLLKKYCLFTDDV